MVGEEIHHLADRETKIWRAEYSITHSYKQKQEDKHNFLIHVSKFYELDSHP